MRMVTFECTHLLQMSVFESKPVFPKSTPFHSIWAIPKYFTFAYTEQT
jgi:hypothetical protein